MMLCIGLTERLDDLWHCSQVMTAMTDLNLRGNKLGAEGAAALVPALSVGFMPVFARDDAVYRLD